MLPGTDAAGRGRVSARLCVRAQPVSRSHINETCSAPERDFLQLGRLAGVERNDHHFFALGKKLMRNALPDDLALLFDRVASRPNGIIAPSTPPIFDRPGLQK